MSRVYANPAELEDAAKQIKGATRELQSLRTSLRGTSYPAMPADVRLRVEHDISAALDDLHVVTVDSAGLAVMLARTAMKFRKTDGDNDGQIQLGAAMAALDGRKLLVEFVGTNQLLPGEPPDGPFGAWTQFLVDMVFGVGAVGVAKPKHSMIVKTKKGTQNRGRIRVDRATGRSTRYLYYGRYLRNEFITNVLRKSVPANKANYGKVKVPDTPRVWGKTGLVAARAFTVAAAGAGGYMEYRNSEGRHKYNLTLGDTGVKTRSGLESGVKTAAAVGGGIALGGVCGTAAAPTGVGVAPAVAVCGAVGSFVGGKAASVAISIWKKL